MIRDITTLTVQHGMLFVGDTLILVSHAGGDCDTVPWPLTSEFRSDSVLRYQLAAGLYDMCEMGLLAYEHDVALPDGSLFDYRKVLWEKITA